MPRPSLHTTRTTRRAPHAWLTLPIILALSLALGACNGLAGPGASGKSSDTILFGAPISLTGSLAKEGGLTRDGYEIWKDTYSQAGGIKVGGKQ